MVKVPLIESSLRSPSSLLSSDFVHFFLPCQILHDHQTCKPSLSARGLYKSDHHQFYCHQIRTRGPATKVGRGHQREMCPYTVKSVYNSHPWEMARWSFKVVKMRRQLWGFCRLWIIEKKRIMSLVICVLLPEKHISLVICVPLPGKHISLVRCVSLWVDFISLGTCVAG